MRGREEEEEENIRGFWSRDIKMCCLRSFLKGWICQRNHFSSLVFPEQNICPVKPSRRAAESMSEQFAKAAAPPRLQLRADRWLDRVDGVHACDW